MQLKMSMSEDQTYKLFSTFMPRKKEIKSMTNDVYAIQVYDKESTFEDFGPKTIYTKWAAVEVNAEVQVPEAMEEFSIPSGKYAVFTHKGTIADFFQKTNPFIYGQWLPKSGYSLADRPHFQVMGEKYLGDNPASEEEVWVPID